MKKNPKPGKTLNQGQERGPGSEYLLAGAIALFTLMLYLPSLKNGFVDWPGISVRSWDTYPRHVRYVMQCTVCRQYPALSQPCVLRNLCYFLRPDFQNSFLLRLRPQDA